MNKLVDNSPRYAVSNNRRCFNEEFLPKFIGLLKPGDIVYDIGKSGRWDYKPLFEQQTYVTVDINPDVKPDIVDDLENTKIAANSVDGLICCGVWEQTKNPFELIKGLVKILKVNGIALFGIVSIGYPLYSKDYLRFTPMGAEKLFSRFSLLDKKIVYVNENPEYLFYIYEKYI